MAKKFVRSRAGIATLCGVVLLALFLARPGANRLRSRIVNSISAALARPVEVSSVSLRFLPRPGFDLENFVVYDDPAFGAEPMLRASEVTATLRLTSLLRGHLDISRLSLTEPSVNLVRNPDGHWNLEGLLQRAAETPVAPTSKSTSEVRPGFPYIEADHGRINFKIGQEKKPYTLSDAEFAFWQDSEDTWGARLQARPVRTDFNLTDTGLLHVNGSWRRAPSLRETPLQFTLRWESGQLGQVSQLVYGRDRGWRGGVELSAILSGTPSNLSIKTNGTIDDFRRFDILGGGALRLAAACAGRYSSIERSFSDISCHAPVGGGELAAEGSVADLRGTPLYNLKVAAHNVPLASAAALARRSKKDLPEDIEASGALNGALSYQGKGAEACWKGSGESTDFRLLSQLTHTQVAVDRIPLLISHSLPNKQDKYSTGETQLQAGPFHLQLGKPGNVGVRAVFSRSAYSVDVSGEGSIARLLQTARTVGLAVPQHAAEGQAKVNVRIAGAWRGFAEPDIGGTVQIHSVEAEIKGLSTPLRIDSATLSIEPAQILVRHVNASLAGSSWHGSLAFPRHCAPATCPLEFDLHADNIVTQDLARISHPSPFKRPWYRFFSSTSQPAIPYLATLHARGRITAGRIQIHRLSATHVAADIELNRGELRLSNLQAEVLGGQHRGELSVNFESKPPIYRGRGTLAGIQLNQLAPDAQNASMTGTAAASYAGTASGSSLDELLSSADVAIDVDAREGTFPRIALASNSGALRVRHLSGNVRLHNANFEVVTGRLDSLQGGYTVTGTAALSGDLNLKLAGDGARNFTITGTLKAPRVAPPTVVETQAALKP